MHVQIVTYGLHGMTEGEYIDIATRLAPRFASLPGLLAKVWLESPADGVYGAVYLWEDREAMERFLATDLFEGTNPDFADFGSDDFSVLENLTRATQPALTVLDDPGARGRGPARAVAPRAAPAIARAPRAVKAAPATRATRVNPPAKAAPAVKAVKAAKAPRTVAPPARPSRARSAAPPAPPDPPPTTRAKPRPPAARPRRPAG